MLEKIIALMLFLSFRLSVCLHVPLQEHLGDNKHVVFLTKKKKTDKKTNSFGTLRVHVRQKSGLFPPGNCLDVNFQRVLPLLYS